MAEEDDNESSGSWNSDTREALYLDQKRYSVLLFSFLALFANIIAENIIQSARATVKNSELTYYREIMKTIPKNRVLSSGCSITTSIA